MREYHLSGVGMRVFVLGGTGSIGGPVVRELIRAGHEVMALARSAASAATVARIGARPIVGDMTTPERWIAALPPLDGVIQAAAAFGADDEAVERRLLQILLPHLRAADRPVRFIYTGGCWLFGESEARTVTTEATPFDPLPAFAWGVAHCRQVLDARGIDPIVIHPAMVYEPCGGVFARFRTDAIGRDAVRVVAGEQVHWPLVHAEDLAALYRLALEGSAPGESYLGAAIDGMPVGRIARAYARRYGIRRTDPEVISADRIAAELGEWARGYALHQWQSGEKARRRLGWRPLHLDPVSEIGAIP
jgi:nucleoside-diphosphate-sugar epimerase